MNYAIKRAIKSIRNGGYPNLSIITDSTVKKILKEIVNGGRPTVRTGNVEIDTVKTTDDDENWDIILSTPSGTINGRMITGGSTFKLSGISGSSYCIVSNGTNYYVINQGGEVFSQSGADETDVFFAGNRAGDEWNGISQDLVFAGTNAGQKQTGTHVISLLKDSGLENTGDDCFFGGYGSGWFNIGSNVNALGKYSCEENLGSNINALGKYSCEYNEGDYVNGFGYRAGVLNLGNFVNALGLLSAGENLGSKVNALGDYSCEYNEGDYVHGFGYRALRYNTGHYVSANGDYSGYHNTADYAMFFGATASPPSNEADGQDKVLMYGENPPTQSDRFLKVNGDLILPTMERLYFGTVNYIDRISIVSDLGYSIKAQSDINFEINSVTLGRFEADDENFYVINDLIANSMNITECLADFNERTGFVNLADSEFNITDGTRTFEIAPVSTSWDMYSNTKKITKSSAESVVWTDVEGMHYIYYTSAGVLTHTTTFDASMINEDKILVSAFYWDATNKERLLDSELDERHLGQMDGATHLAIHNSLGMQITSGLALTNIDSEQSGASDSHAQFGVATGNIADEDIRKTVASIGLTTGLPVIYLDGASGNVRNGTPTSGFSLLNQASGRVQYNEWTGSAWQLTEVTNNRYVLYHVFASTMYDGSKQMFVMVGQNQYSTRSAARAGALTEIKSIKTSSLPLAEFHAVATVIIQTGNSYGNAVKARIRSTGTGEDYVDWRGSLLGSSNNSVLTTDAGNVSVDTTGFTVITSTATDVQKLADAVDTTFEPVFSKNTAFNKNFGTSAGTVKEGFSENTAFNKNFAGSGSATTVSRSDHNHSGTYEPVFSKNTAFNKNFAGTGSATTVSKSDHTHSGQYPTGSYMDFATGILPTGYLECNGAAISRTSYSALFAVISDDYGNGNGSTTFNLPDWRGKFPRCWDHGAGVDLGAEINATGTTTNGSAVVTGISSLTNVEVDMLIIGTGIPAGTTVISIDSSSQITMSDVSGLTGSRSLVFTNRTDRGDGTTGDYVGTEQADELESHAHGVIGYKGTVSSTYLAGGSTADNGTTRDSNSYGGNETRPVNKNQMRCIKY